MYGNGADISICSLNRQKIVGLGLASIALTIASLIPSKPVIAQDNNLIASFETPIVRSAA